VILMQRLGAILASAILTFGATTNSAMASLTVDQDGLREIKAISVLVEGIRSNSCGVTEDQVETSARYTLSQSRVHVSSGRESSLYFNVNLLSDCSAAEVTIELNTTARVVQTNNLSSIGMRRTPK
jgi:hypothetical protein